MIWFLLSWVGSATIVCWWLYAANARSTRVDEEPVVRILSKVG
jgi:hypothetical protein